MKTITQIVTEYGRDGHPLGKSINAEDVPLLVNQLRKRLVLTKHDLDLSPESLKRLENKLFEMPIDELNQGSNEEEIVQFVRELAAYVGEVLSKHAGGSWEPSGTLWSTRIVFEDGIKILKEGKMRLVPSVAFSLGNIASAALDMKILGKKPLLYRDYVSAKKKMLKEN